MRFRVAVVGVTGYSGLELVRVALRHPAMNCVTVMASESTGHRPLVDIHPQLRGLTDLVCEPQDTERLGAMDIDTAFLCTPNEVSAPLVPKLLSKGLRVIDLSGSFRLRQPASYPSWYGFEHTAPGLLAESVYGLPEWNAGEIAKASLVANPGCYPTSALLPLLPLVRADMLERGSDILCDSKSGVTGAGRSAKVNLLFGELSGNFKPYSPITHRHAPEICQELDWDLDHFSFVPHLLPVNRGILSTLYVSFKKEMSSEQLEAEYRRCYSSHSFIRILGTGTLPELHSVAHTNFCDIAWRLRREGRRAVLFSAIDNLMKGAAGQAVQNFNLMHGLDPGLGLMEGVLVAVHS